LRYCESNEYKCMCNVRDRYREKARDEINKCGWYRPKSDQSRLVGHLLNVNALLILPRILILLTFFTLSEDRSLYKIHDRLISVLTISKNERHICAWFDIIIAREAWKDHKRANRAINMRDWPRYGFMQLSQKIHLLIGECCQCCHEIRCEWRVRFVYKFQISVSSLKHINELLIRVINRLH